jgi:hypothetical protein
MPDGQHGVNDVVGMFGKIFIELIEKRLIAPAARRSSGFQKHAHFRRYILRETRRDELHLMPVGAKRMGQVNGISFRPSPGWVSVKNDKGDAHPRPCDTGVSPVIGVFNEGSISIAKHSTRARRPCHA